MQRADCALTYKGQTGGFSAIVTGKAGETEEAAILAATAELDHYEAYYRDLGYTLLKGEVYLSCQTCKGCGVIYKKRRGYRFGKETPCKACKSSGIIRMVETREY